MKIVLHIGSPKAGSSTIQQSLIASREILLKSQILVPSENGRLISQRVLAAMLWEKDSTALYEESFADIDRQIRETHPDTLILSSEYLWGSGGSVATIAQNLSRWSNDIAVIAFVREPAGLYRSTQQQRMKSSHIIQDPATWDAGLASSILQWSKALGTGFHAVPLQKSAFAGGDLFRHFISLACPQELARFEDLKVINSNESEIAEISCIMQRFFEINHKGAEKHNFNRRVADRLRRSLNEFAREAGIGTRAELHLEIRQAVLFNHRSDLHVLKDQFGVIFDDVDYSALNEYKPIPPDADGIKLSAIMTVDDAVVRQLEYVALRHFVGLATERKIRVT